MAKEILNTSVDGHPLKLSNPKKLLYPAVNISKAEVIQYYLLVADAMLIHIARRPLTLIRFPDGAEGKQFYSKNKPDWTPDWIASTTIHKEDDNQYLLANERATLAWIGNLAGLEIHPMNMRSPNLTFPDQFIFDLDPPENFEFDELKLLAEKLREFLLTFGYQPFIKTSGSKGLHIYVPITPIYSQTEVYDVLSKLTKEFVSDYSKLATLSLSKTKRKGRVLIDIFRNRSTATCVAPYSLRGKANAPVSMPIEWNELTKLTSAQAFTIQDVPKRLTNKGDAWATIWEQAVALHTKRTQAKPSQLATYDNKRDFNITTEPTGEEAIHTTGNQYTVQLHDASNLHYDLRLEENGVLLSWAIPKGFPHQVGIKRLAVRTEDHPLKYLEFEGNIPKEEYGGGTMWIFDTGSYDVIKKSENKYHFHLNNGQLAGEYLLYHIKKNQWILERKTNNEFSIEELKQPMLASSSSTIPTGDWLYEIKWDGIRVILFIAENKITIYSRNGNDITTQFPILSKEILKQVNAEYAVIDAEIVHLDEEGKPIFSKIVSRLHTVGDQSISLASKKAKASCYVFDLLYLDGKDCRTATNERRRAWLETILTSNDEIRFSSAFDDGTALFKAIGEQGMEGIVAKKKYGIYRNDHRSTDWVKVKVRHKDTAIAIGYTKGEGDRSELLGAIHLAKFENDTLVYKGKVGSGFTNKQLQAIYKKLSAVPTTDKPIKTSIENESDTTWIEPKYLVELNYASFSSNKTYREPVFKQLIKRKH